MDSLAKPNGNESNKTWPAQSLPSGNMGERLAGVEGIVIDTVLNLLFRCAHRHPTRPFTPLDKQGVPHGETYVVCLDCTKQFAYDLKEMKIGKVIDHSHDAWIMPPDMRKPRKTMLVYALGVAVPVAVLLGAALRAKKPIPASALTVDLRSYQRALVSALRCASNVGAPWTRLVRGRHELDGDPVIADNGSGQVRPRCRATIQIRPMSKEMRTYGSTIAYYV